MSRTIKDDLLPQLREGCARRGREGKIRMLDELCEDYDYERKHAIKLLGDTVPAPGGPLMNFFLPGLKLKEKWREKSQWKKRYEPARTAYQRLRKAGGLGRKARQELRARDESLDPGALQAELERRLQPILAGTAERVRRPQATSLGGGAIDRTTTMKTEHSNWSQPPWPTQHPSVSFIHEARGPGEPAERRDAEKQNPGHHQR